MQRKCSTLLIPAVMMLSHAQAGNAQQITDADAINAVKAAQAYRGGKQPVKPVSDTTIIAEAEEFRVARSNVKQQGWQARPWGENYYAATFAISFLSRQAFLGAPEQATNTVASIDVEVPKAGRYLALVRYEAAPRFETQFKLRVQQNGQTKLDRLYGARDNLKVWAFHQKLQKEVIWSWGAVENTVWEGHDAYVDLQAGKATLSLIADKQPVPAAKRNVDLVLLTSDEEQVKMRIEKEAYLPLDGMLTQASDVYLRVHNQAGSTPVTVTVGNGDEHSPYWIHIRDWKPKIINAKPGEITDWIEVGSLLDTLNDGQWHIGAKADKEGAALSYNLEFGVRTADGKIQPIRKIENQTGGVTLAYHGDTRYSRRIGTSAEVVEALVNYMKQRPVHGTPPQRTLIYGAFQAHRDNPRYMAALHELNRLVGATALNVGGPNPLPGPPGLARGFDDVRDKTPQQLEEWAQKLKAENKADQMVVISLGDEIGLPAPTPENQGGFHAWLQQRGLKPSDLDPAAGDDWSKVLYNVSQETAKQNPALFYYSKLYSHHFGIQAQKAMTDVLRKYLPNAGIGANYSPHGSTPYVGETHQFITMFREGGMTLPWGEDYIWQVPVGSQQMNFLQLDMFRAGIKGKPDAKILFYVMPHTPGNTVNSWRRQWYGSIGHGAKILNLFEFDPVQVAYTENHTSDPAMYQEVRRSIHELGLFEDIVQDGQVLPGIAGLWFSETGDIWGDNRDPFDAAKRSLYVAIRHQQLPLDAVVEQDALSGDLKNYKVLYLTDQHVSRAASQAIANWVEAGGRLFATAGAGMFDELNRPNPILRGLLGVDQQELQVEEKPVAFEKQDLPFAKPLDTVTWKASAGEFKIPVISVRSRFKANGSEVQATFADGTPAVTVRTVGTGTATYAAFFPGLSYFKPAIPLRPVDRGSTDDAMAHFIPTNFDRGSSSLIGSVATGLERPVVSSNPLADATIIKAKQGIVIPLTNWSSGPIKGLKVTLFDDVAGEVKPGQVKLASGKPMKMEMPIDSSSPRTRRVFTFDLDVADALIIR